MTGGNATIVRHLAMLVVGVVACKGEPDRGQPPAKVTPSTTSDASRRDHESTTGEPDGPPVRKDGTVLGETQQMGTRVTINVWLDPGRTAREAGQAINDAIAEIERVEDIMSEWRPLSELSKFTARSGEPVEISAELFDVLERSVAISRETDGAFDVTFHGVGQLWSFQPGSKPPTRAEIDRKLALVDWRKLELDPDNKTARLQPGMKIGLGAIAKGYAVDRASGVLLEHGFRNHIVEAGGDTFVSGTKAGKDWNVGVQNPAGGRPLGVIPSRGGAIVTSGDYQRFFEHEGKRYAHILDPKTGWPIEASNSPKSVTLLAPNATDADAYCTAVTVMGADKGMALVEANAKLDAVIITRQDEVLVSSGLRGRYIDTSNPSPTK